MKLINTIKAGGATAVVGAGATVLFGQQLLHWVTMPSHLLPVAGVAAIGGLAKWASSHKAKEQAEEEQADQAIDARIVRLAEEVGRQRATQALPPSRTVRFDDVIDFAPQVQAHEGR